VCRALTVLCVAESPLRLAELKRATVSAEWELLPGATDEQDALRQLHELRPHVAVVFGPFAGFVRRALQSFPALHVVADRALPGASVIATSLEEVRAAVLERPRPAGPVGP
jgi:hypothetical protein